MKKLMKKISFAMVGIMASVPAMAAVNYNNVLCKLATEFNGIFNLLRTLAFIGAGMSIAGWALGYIKAGKIDAYEVYNYMESYPLTFDWYAQYGIAPMANTDIHGPVAMDYDCGEGWMRPMTLVFASEKTQEALKEALEAKRTLALFQGNLVGDKEYLSKLVSASLKTEETAGRLSVTNISDITYTMTLGDDLYIFPAGMTVIISRPEGELTVQNCLWGNGKHLTYMFL